MIDVDDFKKYNDTYGHPAGDEILKKLGQVFLKRSRATDFVARFGGEEFAVIAPHTDKKNASILAGRLVDMVLREEFNFIPTHQNCASKAAEKAGRDLEKKDITKVTVSIGLATFQDDANTGDDLLKCADVALYQAKTLGKNRICLFGIEKT
jgi:diguanylate cyclase (GGDEF)-like protein